MLIRMSDRFMDLGDAKHGYAAITKAEAIAENSNDAASIARTECGAVAPTLVLGNIEEASAWLSRGRSALAHLSHPGVSLTVTCGEAESEFHEAQNDLPAAIRSAEGAVGALEQAGETHDQQYIDELSQVARLYFSSDDAKKAFEFHRRLETMLERNDQMNTIAYLAVQHDLANDLYDFGEIRGAFAREQRVVTMARSIDSDGASHLPIMAVYGNFQFRLGQPESAIESYAAAIAEFHRSGNLKSELGARINRARALLLANRLDDADAELREVGGQITSQETTSTLLLARWQIVRAQLLLAQGRLQTAQLQIDSALMGLRGEATGAATYVGTALLTASRIARAQRRFGDAERFASDALKPFERLARQPEQSADVGEALLLIAQARRESGDASGARAFAVRARVSLESGLGPGHSLTRAAVALL
jgi:tetratricopeptide (TPR) repeat protein